jgi:hypothetical protein
MKLALTATLVTPGIREIIKRSSVTDNGLWGALTPLPDSLRCYLDDEFRIPHPSMTAAQRRLSMQQPPTAAWVSQAEHPARPRSTIVTQAPEYNL